MKKTSCLLALLLANFYLFAQGPGFRSLSAIPTVEISAGTGLHFRSPEAIRYVDLSTKLLSGDLPIKNLLNVKISSDSVKRNLPLNRELGVVTIVGETFMAQYRLFLSPHVSTDRSAVDIEILPSEMVPLDPSHQDLSTPEIKSHAMAVLAKRGSRPLARSTMLGICAQLNQVYTVGELIFLDISFKNKTLMEYDIDELKFSVEDKKVHKATNLQSIEISPVFSLYSSERFKRNFRNIYVIKKVSFSSEKLLKVSMSEKQLSKRTLSLSISYGDLLNADTF
ncbi:DUF4138 domain-containing protein [Pedobacter ghigonis]|uniref:DUF4138 domain-containing protein n=1 Tax=Pedobacter ghigonis TaxID=2730403 RepID=UPI00158D8EB9|nr:DUF4138 domain-containing protein [Pedobacter ghigonis]